MTISAISIYVSDLTAAAQFYVDILGFRIERSIGEYATKLVHDGPSLLLCAGGPADEAPRYPAGIVLGHRTANLTQRIAELRAKGVTFLQESPEPFPKGQFIAFRDPFGMCHELLEYSDS
jgi:catechol 2,3-dioxygenase-like lactoylglutathione lyase family enzyme